MRTKIGYVIHALHSLMQQSHFRTSGKVIYLKGRLRQDFKIWEKNYHQTYLLWTKTPTPSQPSHSNYSKLESNDQQERTKFARRSVTMGVVEKHWISSYMDYLLLKKTQINLEFKSTVLLDISLIE